MLPALRLPLSLPDRPGVVSPKSKRAHQCQRVFGSIQNAGSDLSGPPNSSEHHRIRTKAQGKKVKFQTFAMTFLPSTNKVQSVQGHHPEM